MSPVCLNGSSRPFNRAKPMILRSLEYLSRKAPSAFPERMPTRCYSGSCIAHLPPTMMRISIYPARVLSILAMSPCMLLTLPAARKTSNPLSRKSPTPGNTGVGDLCEGEVLCDNMGNIAESFCREKITLAYLGRGEGNVHDRTDYRAYLDYACKS